MLERTGYNFIVLHTLRGVASSTCMSGMLQKNFHTCKFFIAHSCNACMQQSYEWPDSCTNACLQISSFLLFWLALSWLSSLPDTSLNWGQESSWNTEQPGTLWIIFHGAVYSFSSLTHFSLLKFCAQKLSRSYAYDVCHNSSSEQSSTIMWLQPWACFRSNEGGNMK